jgi:2-polyprenyl-3-methyl-5-hydroxy-6-metoxy-1,4-benzoquinol methylase
MQNDDFMTKYLSGRFLYGDDFSQEEIIKWYEHEQEAYANLYGIVRGEYNYHKLNVLYGYRHIKIKTFNHVLGFGSSWGYEFLPIIARIKNLTILDSSTQTVSLRLGNIVPTYKKTNISGKIDFPDNTFDLITCFGVLHHIPNVTFVLGELMRVIKPGGYLLIREPVISMGDWRYKRPGLTINERGIPKDYISNIIRNLNLEVVRKEYCLCTMFTKFLNKNLYNNKFLLQLDKILSAWLSFNIHYHATNKWQRLQPDSVFYVLRKHLFEN